MKVGITYDLVEDHVRNGMSAEDAAELDSQETIDAIDATLQELGFDTDRIGSIQALVNRLAAGDRWDLVFNIAEGIHGLGREAQVPALLDAYHIPYTFADPMVLGLCLHKGMAKHVVRDAGVLTPDFAVIGEIADVAGITLGFPVFVKPVAEGTSKGISKASVASNREELSSICAELLHRFREPVLVETFLPGREFTVGILGTGPRARAVGVLEVGLRNNAEPGGYTYHNKQHYEDLIELRLANDEVAAQAETVALAAWQVLGCRDAGRVDIRCDVDGVPQFIEANPLAGLNPRRSDLPIICHHQGLGYLDLIAAIMASARERWP